MLSFDITDRHIRIIDGTEAGKRVNVRTASTIDLEEGLIVNGHIKDIPKMAGIISQELKEKRMSNSKEAVVSVSSNLVIFKELHIPKAKGNSLLAMVTNQMQHAMGISGDYSISYSIAGEIIEDGVPALKILATACPFDVVDCYRQVFAMLSMTLRSVMVSCNAISRIILSEKKNSAKMPMLAVQIDPSFISLNLYEDGQLSFSRFASIDAVDYGNSEDYIFEAVNENILRMLQFQKSRNANNPIQNVVFYGDTSEYIRLTNALEAQDISTSLLGVPNNIGGYENFEFQSYANAIGAMFKSDKETERVNLLETDDKSGKTAAGAKFGIAALIAAGASAGVVAIVCLIIGFGISANQKKIDDINDWINSEETQNTLKEVDDTQARIDKLAAFKAGVEAADYNLESLPKFVYSDIEKLRNEVFYTGDAEGLDAFATSIAFVEGEYHYEVYTLDPRAPAAIVERFDKIGMFDNILYEGYERITDFSGLYGEEEEPAEGEVAPTYVWTDVDVYKFEVSGLLKGSSVEKYYSGEGADEETADEGAGEEGNE